MKLLILTQKMDSNDSNLGFFHRWVEEFAKRCESVIVICLYEGTHALPANVRVLSLGKEEGASRIKYLRRFYSYIARERHEYDSVFVHMNQIYVVLGGLFWRMIRRPVGLWYAHGAVSISLRLAAMLANTIFTSTAEGFRIETKKRRIVGQGIDTTLFDPKRDYAINGPVRLITMGRITPVKRIDMMIDAAALLRDRGIAATLDIFGAVDSGNDAYIDELKAYAERAGIGGSVRFVGGVPYRDLPMLLPGYDLFINAGMTGSLDKALLDAAAAGLPIVSSNPAFEAFAGEDAGKSMCDAHAQSMSDSAAYLVSLGADERARIGAALRRRVVKQHELSSLVTKIASLMSLNG